MREAAESPDNLAVSFGVIQEILKGRLIGARYLRYETLYETHAFILMLDRFGVFQR